MTIIGWGGALLVFLIVIGVVMCARVAATADRALDRALEDEAYRTYSRYRAADEGAVSSREPVAAGDHTPPTAPAA